MRISGTIEAFDQVLETIISDELSPEAQARSFSIMAQVEIERAADWNQRALGMMPERETRVDGSPVSEPLGPVPISSTITSEFDLQPGVVDWIWAQVMLHAPHRAGKYRDTIKLFADGVEVSEPNPGLRAEEWVIVATVPYARKIEGAGKRPPQSPMAPNGVMQVVATLAKKRFGNMAAIKFTYRTLTGTDAGVVSWALKATRAKVRKKNKSEKYLPYNHERALARNTRNPAIMIRFYGA